jgi:hypothetical protein
MPKRVKPQWGCRYGFLRFTRDRAAVRLDDDAPALATDGASDTGATLQGVDDADGPFTKRDGRRGAVSPAGVAAAAAGSADGVFQWYADDDANANAATGARLRRFTSAERLRLLLDKLALSRRVSRFDSLDVGALHGLRDPPAAAAGCLAARAARARLESARRAAGLLGALRACGAGAADAPAAADGGERALDGPADGRAPPSAALAFFAEAVPVHEHARRRRIRSLWVYRTKSAFRQIWSRRAGAASGDNELLRELDLLHDYFGAQVVLYSLFFLLRLRRS